MNGLLTDLYELTMAAGYFQAGKMLKVGQALSPANSTVSFFQAGKTVGPAPALPTRK